MMPKPVLGGATLVLFGLIAGAGFRLINQTELGNKEVLIIAISLGMAFGIPTQEAFVDSLPSVLAGILGSSVATGGLTAVLLCLMYRQPKTASVEDILES